MRVGDDEDVGLDRVGARVRDRVFAADEEGDGAVVDDAPQLGGEVVEVRGHVVPGTHVAGVVDAQRGEAAVGAAVVVVVRLGESPDPVRSEPGARLKSGRGVERSADDHVGSSFAVGRRPGEHADYPMIFRWPS